MDVAVGKPVQAAIRSGAEVTVRVPATSANLGPGFDSFALALGLYDLITLAVLPSGLDVRVDGEGAGCVPLTEEHLVVRAVRAGFDHAGAPQPGLRLACRNGIPHGRGLGSSASAVVAGLVAARHCLADPGILDDAAVLDLATRFEGHPDNAAAALLGGCTVAWTEGDTSGTARAVRLELDPAVDAVVCLPADELATSKARAMLPPTVPHADAAFNAGRAGLLVAALTQHPNLLLAATEERLHQEQRAGAMPETARLLHRLRAAGHAAVVSGAGPSLLVLSSGSSGGIGPGADAVRDTIQKLTDGLGQWRVIRPGLDTFGASLTTEGD